MSPSLSSNRLKLSVNFDEFYLPNGYTDGFELDADFELIVFSQRCQILKLLSEPV